MTHRRNQKYKARRRHRVAVARYRRAFEFGSLDYYDRRGRRIPPWRWHELLAADRYRIIEQTVVGPILVSTVWLGLDHGFGAGLGQSEPVIFETMLFDAATHRSLDWQDRYCSLADAQLGHAAVVAKLRALGTQATEWLLDEIRD
jgi:hypothetical protein